VASLRRRHAAEYAPKAEKSLRDAAKRRYLNSSGLSLLQFDQVYDQFVLHSRIASSEHGIKDYRRLSSLESFHQVLHSLNAWPNIAFTTGATTTGDSTTTAAALFAAFDSDGTGSVDVDELFCGLGLLLPQNSLIRKLEVCFELFDHNRDSYISGADIVHVVWTVMRLNQKDGDRRKRRRRRDQNRTTTTNNTTTNTITNNNTTNNNTIHLTNTMENTAAKNIDAEEIASSEQPSELSSRSVRFQVPETAAVPFTIPVTVPVIAVPTTTDVVQIVKRGLVELGKKSPMSTENVSFEEFRYNGTLYLFLRVSTCVYLFLRSTQHQETTFCLPCFAFSHYNLIFEAEDKNPLRPPLTACSR
jgi:Ca2+-binding EF-hand superfamily protein